MGEWGDYKKQVNRSAVQDPRYAPIAKQDEVRGEWDEMKRRVQLEKQKAEEQGVDLDTGGDFIDRVAVGIKITPQGKAGYLESKFGQGNVRESSGGELEFRTAPDGRWTRLDEKGLSWRDLGDLSGDMVETAPAALGGTLTASPAGAAAGAFAGNLARQGLSELIPGNEGMDTTDRAAMSLTSALLGAGSQYGANRIIDALDKARPHNLALPILVNKSNDRVARLGESLMDKTGVDLRKDQLTGNPTAQMIMGLMRRHPSTATMVKEQEVKQLGQLRGYFDRVMDSVSTAKIGKETAANRAIGAYEKYVDNLGETMSRVGGEKFNEVWDLAATLPDKRIMSVKNAVAEWKKIIEDFDTPMGGDTATKIVAHAKKQIEAIEANGSLLDPKQFQRSMSIFSKASRGTGDIVTDVKDRSVQRSIAARVSKALSKDLDETVDAGGLTGEVAEKLAAARDYYKAAATEIEQVTDSILSSVVGKPGEETIRNFAGGWAASEVRAAMGMMQKVSPEAADAVKRGVLQDVFDRSKPSGSGSVIGGANFSPAKLITNANKADKNIRAMFAATDDMEGYAAWRNGIKVAQRIADHAGTDGSPTAPLQWTMSLVKSFTGHAWPFDAKGMAVDIAAVLAPRKLQQAMLTNQGRQALFEVTRTGNSVRTVSTALAYLKGIDERDEKGPSVDQRVRKESGLSGGDFISGAVQ